MFARLSLPGCLLAALWVFSLAAAPEVDAMDLRVHNPRASAADEIVRLSVPVPAGLLPGEPPPLVLRGEERLPAQATVITRHPDGSVRRVMLSFPLALPPNTSAELRYAPAAAAPAHPPSEIAAGAITTIATAPWFLHFRDGALQIADREGRVLGVVRAFGPDLVEPQTPVVTVIDRGPYVTWLRWRQDGADYSREVDVLADRTGRVRLTQRILRHLPDNGWAPDFGFELSALGAQAVSLPQAPVHFRALPIASPLADHPELVASLRLGDGSQLSLANPEALRQHRGTLSATAGANGVTVRLSRIEPVGDEMQNLQLQEGMWRSIDVVLQPGPPAQLTGAIDQPLIATVDWRAYDAVYHTGPPLQVETPLLADLAERYVQAIAALPALGDDLGSLGGLERYNHCQYIWEDYFRSGDPRLHRVALDYSANYNDLSIYWGPNPDYYGGGRYPPDARTQPWPTDFRTRHNNAVSFCTKGYHGFWLAYEDTGDPRYRYAAEQQAQWSAAHVTAGLNYTRCIGQVIDLVKLHEYTGDRFYLDQAARLWGDLQAVQTPDLLFTESGRPALGNDLYVPDDRFGYEHPYVKSYIVQYATNSLPYLLAHQPDDERLRATIIACNDWMARVQTPGGGWSYPGPTTAGLRWSPEYCHGLIMGYEVAGKPEYLEAVGRDLRAIAVLYAAYGAIPSGVTPWETLAGMSADELGRRYTLGTDRDRSRDFTDGRVEFGGNADSTVYFMVLLRDYLRHRPEASLLAPDPVLDQILSMPASIAGGYPQSGDPSLRIIVAASAGPEGLVARLAARAIYRLADRTLTWRWVLPDGSEATGPAVSWTFSRSGEYEVTLIASDGAAEHARTVTIAAPTGPGDVGARHWPGGIRVQAEQFVEQGGGASGVKARGPGEKVASDGGSISHWDPLGAWVQWQVDVPETGEYYLLAHYASPTACERAVTLDGNGLGVLRMRPTGGYSSTADDWRTEILRDEAGQPLALHLSAGRHVLRLANTDGKGCNLDYLALTRVP